MSRVAWLFAGLVAMAGVVHADPPPDAAPGQPDLTGVWFIINPPHALRTADGSLPPLTPSARQIYERHLAEAKRGDRAAFDGTYRCLPPGLPRLMLSKAPFEILQRPKVVYFVSEDNRLPRRAYLNEKLPDDPDPAWLGYSVGRWEGDTLVVDSAGFNDETLLDEAGLPHSEQLHLTERYRLSHDGQHLAAEFTIEDPKDYTRPWSVRAQYVRRAGYEIPAEICMDDPARRAAAMKATEAAVK
ncbi:MAG TPA: hypothetical protein VME21_02765 [Steroidobacteraceae bacterium]|nr:hypothetical protein [Steroidobacteraceae bacterium]